MESRLDEIKLSVIEDLGNGHPKLKAIFLKNWLRYKASAQLVVENIPPARRARVLDYGCGHPFVSRILSDLGYQVTAFEPYAGVESETASLLGIGPAFCKELPSGIKFDAVLMIDVIEHLSVIKPIMSHVNQLTADNGLLFVSTPNVMRIEMWLSFILRRTGHPQALSTFLKSNDNYTDHQREFTRKELNLTLKHFGYEVIFSRCRSTRDRKALNAYQAFLDDHQRPKSRKAKIYHAVIDGLGACFPGTLANNLFAIGRKTSNA